MAYFEFQKFRDLAVFYFSPYSFVLNWEGGVKLHFLEVSPSTAFYNDLTQNHVLNILRLFGGCANLPFTTSEK